MPSVGINKILVPKERTFDRGQGCWNCVNGVKATKFWSDRRQVDLNTALKLSIESPDGEKDLKVYNIKKMVDTLDHAVASGALIHCHNNIGRTATGQPVGDLVAHSYLCDRWTGAPGASMARGGAKPDELPEELIEKLDGVVNRPLIKKD